MTWWNGPMPTGKPCRNSTHEKYAPPSKGCATCTRKNMIEKRAEYKRLVFNHYGTSCACCGLSVPELLTIDHVDASTKVKNGRTGHKIYLDLVKSGYPEGYQSLCFSCNSGKHGHRGVCPHQGAPTVGNQRVEWSRQVKLEAFSRYGNGSCACCGETNPYLLTLHHVNGDGAAHRTLLSGQSASWIYGSLKTAGWPNNPPLSVACFTCNVGFDLPGGCPCGR
jgi:hypothetical protein